eukprot:Hpha_TRINITY_DN1294_c0_g1::TRINITY_DN1294_c0_g1_i1::g.44741::m.44741
MGGTELRPPRIRVRRRKVAGRRAALRDMVSALGVVQRQNEEESRDDAPVWAFKRKWIPSKVSHGFFLLPVWEQNWRCPSCSHVNAKATRWCRWCRQVRPGAALPRRKPIPVAARPRRDTAPRVERVERRGPRPTREQLALNKLIQRCSTPAQLDRLLREVLATSPHTNAVHLSLCLSRAGQLVRRASEGREATEWRRGSQAVCGRVWDMVRREAKEKGGEGTVLLGDWGPRELASLLWSMAVTRSPQSAEAAGVVAAVLSREGIAVTSPAYAYHVAAIAWSAAALLRSGIGNSRIYWGLLIAAEEAASGLRGSGWCPDVMIMLARGLVAGLNRVPPHFAEVVGPAIPKWDVNNARIALWAVVMARDVGGYLKLLPLIQRRKEESSVAVTLTWATATMEGMAEVTAAALLDPEMGHTLVWALVRVSSDAATRIDSIFERLPLESVQVSPYEFSSYLWAAATTRHSRFRGLCRVYAGAVVSASSPAREPRLVSAVAWALALSDRSGGRPFPAAFDALGDVCSARGFLRPGDDDEIVMLLWAFTRARHRHGRLLQAAWPAITVPSLRPQHLALTAYAAAWARETATLAEVHSEVVKRGGLTSFPAAVSARLVNTFGAARLPVRDLVAAGDGGRDEVEALLNSEAKGAEFKARPVRAPPRKPSFPMHRPP